jgi:mono/diheme cytochrome c family protein
MRNLKQLKQVALISSASLAAILFVALHANGSGSAKAGSIVIPPKAYTPRAADALSAKGKQIFAKEGCAQCHSIANVGGCLGPLLDGVGARRNQAFLVARLSNEPAAVEKFGSLIDPKYSELFEHPRFGPERVKALIAYLMTVPEPKGGFRITDHPNNVEDQEAPHAEEPYKGLPMTASAVDGQRLYQKMGCAQCHSINGLGGYLGPKLDGIGRSHSKAYVASHVTNAQAVAVENAEISRFVQTPMPKFDNISKQDAESIADFLLTLPDR